MSRIPVQSDDSSLLEGSGVRAVDQELIIPLLRIKLNPGISFLNVFTFFYASFANVCALAFLNGSLPYLLTNFLKIPQDSQGNIIGEILMWNELIVIISISFWGILSDKIGRKPIYVLAFFLMGVSIMLHPAAKTVGQLVGIRIIFALGAAASVSMLTALLADYPQDDSRGRGGGVIGLLAGCGALLALFVFLRIPSLARFGAIGAGRTMYWVVGGFFMMTASVLFFGLSDIKIKENKHEQNFYDYYRRNLGCKESPYCIILLGFYGSKR